MFDLLEHPADMGLRAWGATLRQAFENAASALAAVVVELDNVEPRTEYAIEASGVDNESLLVNWLSEVLFLLDARRLALRRFEIRQFEEGRIAGRTWGEPYDPGKHRPKLIVKGVTYHQLRIEKRTDGWVVEVYLDI